MIVMQEAKSKAFIEERLNSLVEAIGLRQFRVLIIEPTSRCNLKCSFCDMHNGLFDTKKMKFDMSDQVFDQIIAALKSLSYKIKSIQVHGYGEPLLHKKTVDMCHQLRPYCESLRLITNGTALTYKKHQELMAVGVDEIHISLDVADKDEYKKVKEKDLYNKVIRNINQVLVWYKSNASTHQKLYIKLALPEIEYENFWGADRSITKSAFDESLEKMRHIAEDSENIHIKIMPLFSTYLVNEKYTDNKPCEMPFYMANSTHKCNTL